MKQAINGANRWTGEPRCVVLSLLDNIYSVKSFLVRKQGMGSKEVDQALEITEDFDSLEYPACLRN